MVWCLTYVIESFSMDRRFLAKFLASMFSLSVLIVVAPAAAADMAGDAFVKQLSDEVLTTIKSDKAFQASDMTKLTALVDTKVMPHVNFRRITASAVGPGWSKATPEQQKQMQEEFKTLLLRTYAGALSQITDQIITVKPLRASAEDTEIVVRTEVRGKGEPIQLDYRLEKTPGAGLGWKIYNLNVMGVWLMETFRSQFAQEINAKGVDGLIATMKARNLAMAAAK